MPDPVRPGPRVPPASRSEEPAPPPAPRAPEGPPTVRIGDVRAPSRVDHVPADPRLSAHRAEGAMAPGLFELTGAHPEAVSLPRLLRAMSADPAAHESVDRILSDFERFTGLPVSDEMRERAMRDPTKILDVLAVTPMQISDGIDALVAAHRAGVVRDAEPKARRLPSTFDLDKLGETQIERPTYQLKKLAGALYQGSLKSDLPDDRAKLNLAFAEIFDRLAENADTPAADRFKVRYRGGEYTRLDTFVRALADAGHEITVEFGHRIANFTDLKTKAPGEPDERARDVPAALMIRTGVRNAEGEEAIVPAAHAEMLIHIRSGAEEGHDADVRFFQGMDSTGFFPDGLSRVPKWCGYVKSELGENGETSLQGDAALKAIEYAGLMSSLINGIAKERGLPFGAYGVTGVCMDSVQVVLDLAARKLTYYPLLMRDGLLFDEIDERLGDRDRRDDPEYRAIAASIGRVPSDIEDNDSKLARIRASIPWTAGGEAFVSTQKARQILGGF